MSVNLSAYLRDVVDFPKPGIVFKDITPLLASPEARREVVQQIANHYRSQSIEMIAGVEARGFIFGTLLAEELAIPFIPIRKAGKLPYHKIQEEYQLEYGKAIIEMHTDAVAKGSRVLIHDDLLATGGTAAAAGKMIQRLGGSVVGYSFVINLSFLPGEALLMERFSVEPHYLIRF
jgi:adenine phosphoribosyltransferase